MKLGLFNSPLAEALPPPPPPPPNLVPKPGRECSVYGVLALLEGGRSGRGQGLAKLVLIALERYSVELKQGDLNVIRTNVLVCLGKLTF